MAVSLAVPLELLHEPPPPLGPLIALGRLMHHYPNQLLLLCPVDMLALDLATLRQFLLAARSSVSSLIHVAHDGSQAVSLPSWATAERQ